MRADPPFALWLALPASGLGLVLLFLAAWDAARTGPSSPKGERRLDRLGLPAGVHGALEIRLVVWCLFVLLLWLRIELEPLRGERPWLAGTVPLGVPAALLAVMAGWIAAALAPCPAVLRRALAPFHGLAMLLTLVWGAAGRGRRSRRPAPSPAANEGLESARRGVRDLASLPLEDLMIPRSQVIALEGSRTGREALRATLRSPHTLHPVFGGSVDQPLGVVRILDLVQPEALDRPVSELAKPAPIVPETMKGFDLLEDLSIDSISAALVVDEFGGMAGFVTLEDLIEVLVGELAGEHEVPRARILPLSDGSYRVEGTTTVEEMNRRLGPMLPEGEYETVAGFVLDRLGRIPRAGEVVAVPGLTLTIEERTDRRILWLRARARSGSESPRAAGRPPRSAPARRA